MILPVLSENDSTHYIQVDSREPLRTLPQVSAIYGLWHPGHAWLYIGATSNLKNRWMHHPRLKNALQLGQCRLCWIEHEQPHSIEMAMIVRYWPVWNPPRSARTFENWLAERKPRLEQTGIWKTPSTPPGKVPKQFKDLWKD